MDFLSYITEQQLVLIPVLYLFGAFLKDTPIVPNWIIPWAILVVGIAGTLGLLGISVESIIQGVLLAGTTVYSNQLIKQTIERN